jgi:hypothetical protein
VRCRQTQAVALVHEGEEVERGSRPPRTHDPYDGARAAMLAALRQAIPSARQTGRPAVIRPALDMSLEDAESLLPAHSDAMLLVVHAPLEIRTVGNILRLVDDGARMGTYPPVVLITHANVELLDVVLGTPCDVIELPTGLMPGVPGIDWP